VPIIILMSARSWLIPRGADRSRMLDMDRRLRPVRRAAFGVLALSLVLSAPWTGWWTIAPLACAAGFFRAADALTARSERPEYALFAAWTASEILIALSVALVGGPASPAMSWLAIPIVTLSARFSGRGIVLGTSIALALLLAVGFGVDSAAVIDDPTLLGAPTSLIIAVALLSTALMKSDVQHRSESVVDPLTGMLNRTALTTRANELAEQSRITGHPVSVIVCDVDHFKTINDQYGHARGDAVLKDLAYLLRKRLRAFDLAYRIGGEEFLVLLPGADVAGGTVIAEALRLAVAGETLAGGLHVTMSFGVAASAGGAAFDFETVFAEADAALYEAKRSGRDRVCPPPQADPPLDAFAVTTART
jgi:diguanylate cyclase (GGDEF)-like protein